MQPGRGEIDDDRDEDDEVARDGDASHRTERGDRVGDGAADQDEGGRSLRRLRGDRWQRGGPASVSP